MCKNVFVLGMDECNLNLSKFLCKENHVTIVDTKCDNYDLINRLQNMGINVVITKDGFDVLEKCYDYVISNDINKQKKVINKARKLNIPILDEMEVIYKYIPKDVKIIGVTGLAGKTITTFLIAEILKLADYNVKVGNNVCSFIEDVKDTDIIVLKIPTSKLMNLHSFKTDISVLTSTCETIDYKRIFNHHTRNDIAILNINDEIDIPSKKLFFSKDKETDCYIKDDKIYYKNEIVCEISDIRLKGVHNFGNVMASILVAKTFNISNEIIKEALDNFSGVPHSLEFVRKINDIEFYNDSKSNNINAIIIALSSFDSPINLILCNQNIDELKPYLYHVNNIIFYGQSNLIIKEFCDSNITIVDSLEEATKLSYNISAKGDTVLFSPGCTDIFYNFEERGNKFKEIVETFK